MLVLRILPIWEQEMLNIIQWPQSIIAISNVLFAVLLGYFYTDYGVVLAYGASIILGSLWLMINFSIRNK